MADLYQGTPVRAVLPEFPTGFNHIQAEVLQVAESRWLFLLNFLEDVVFHAISWIRNHHGLCIADDLLGPVSGAFCSLGEMLEVRIEFGFLGRSKFFLG